MDNILVTVLGPTATGKTSLGVRLAAAFDGEIISADSRQVYRGMNIGTGKDLDEYTTGDQKINYHLIDIADPSSEYNLYTYKKHFIDTYSKITNSGKLPLLVGGTGMYLSAIIQNYRLKEGDFSEEKYNEYSLLTDAELKQRITSVKNPHNKTDFDSRERMIKALQAETGTTELNFPLRNLVIGVHYDRDEVKKRITARLKQRLETGMIEEVKSLLESGISLDKLLFFGLEYKYVALYLSGSLNYNDMFQKLNSSIHAFSKRQMTWFRKMEREGVVINWIEKGDFNKAEEILKKFLKYV